MQKYKMKKNERLDIEASITLKITMNFNQHEHFTFK